MKKIVSALMFIALITFSIAAIAAENQPQD